MSSFPLICVFATENYQPFFQCWSLQDFEGGKKGKPNQYLFSSQRLSCSTHGPIALPGRALEPCWSFRVGTVVISVWFSFDVLQF